jgi:deoxycytidylate deaminase
MRGQMGQAEEKVAPRIVINKSKDATTKKPTDQIDDRKTPELVVALCGAVGAGTSTVAKEIERQFKGYSYDVDIIKVSHLISKQRKSQSDGLSRYERIKRLQEHGNELRKTYGNDFLAQLAIKKIVEKRAKGTELQVDGEMQDYGKKVRVARRHVTIIDSLKHPSEVELLQKVYGKMFCLFGVLCNDSQRKLRLMNEGEMNDGEAGDLMDRDKKEKIKHGQQMLKTLQHSDFFIRNSKRNVTSLERPLGRFVGLLLGQNNLTPTIDEFGMYIAESVARRSGCLSRQVGAAILTEGGDIVSTGRNDVPKPLGGLYGEEDGEHDDRCFKQFDHACANEKGKNRIYSKIEKKISDTFGLLASDEKIVEIIEELKEESEIRDLLEYSRAVHAEMDAITTAARNGNYSLKGTILFSTTFPCHHCARHIVASGIKRVYYIEPYEKSLATRLHPDAITLDSQGDEESESRVVFLHFEGVAPKRYLDLFSCNNRKKGGALALLVPEEQTPAAASFLDTFIEYETKVVEYINKLEAKTGGGQDES